MSEEIKCNKCDGSGSSATLVVVTVNNFDKPFARDISNHEVRENVKCNECTGTGKVKI